MSETFLVNFPLATMSASIVYVGAGWLELTPSAIRGWDVVAMLFMGLCFVIPAIASLLSMTTSTIEQWWAKQHACNASRRWARFRA